MRGEDKMKRQAGVLTLECAGKPQKMRVLYHHWEGSVVLADRIIDRPNSYFIMEPIEYQNQWPTLSGSMLEPVPDNIPLRVAR